MKRPYFTRKSLILLIILLVSWIVPTTGCGGGSSGSSGGGCSCDFCSSADQSGDGDASREQDYAPAPPPPPPPTPSDCVGYEGQTEKKLEFDVVEQSSGMFYYDVSYSIRACEADVHFRLYLQKEGGAEATADLTPNNNVISNGSLISASLNHESAIRYNKLVMSFDDGTDLTRTD